VTRALAGRPDGRRRHRRSWISRYADERDFTGTDETISDHDATPDRSAGSLEAPTLPSARHSQISEADEQEQTSSPDAEPQPPAGMQGEKGPLLRLVRDQRVAFLLVGGTNTVIGTFWFITFQLLIQPVAGYMAVLFCAHVASVLCAFVLYRHFVFKVRGHVLRDLARFEVVNLTALGVNAVTLPILVEVVKLPVLLSQLIITAGTMLVSFFGHRGFSFHRTPAEQAATPRSTR